MSGRQSHITHSQTQKHKKFSWVRGVLILAAILLILVGTAIGIIEGSLANNLSLLLNALGVIFTFLQWLLPVSAPSIPSSVSSSLPPGEHTITQASQFPYSPQSLLASSHPAPYRGIVGFPPPTDSRTIQQRVPLVQEVYARLTRPDITAIALTGIGGAGKSTLAALVYHYTEAQRRAGKGPFTAQTLWLTVNESVTLADMVGTIFEVLGKPQLDLGKLVPHSQALALFNAFNTVEQPRLVILDQFENLLDWQTGHALADRPGVGEWLDAINSQSCACRILLTSRPWPQGTREYPPTYLQEYSVEGLDITEGLDLLKKQGVTASERDLRTTIERCSGHAFALTLLASLLRNHHLSLLTLFNNPVYAQLWTGNIARNLLDQIYTQQLDQFQRQLLLAFSIYREPMPLEAAQTLIDLVPHASQEQVGLAAQTLCLQHLLQPTGSERYQLHAIVTDYAHNHYDDNSEQANQQASHTLHAKAARYYQRQAASLCLPREDRRMSDVQPLIEAVWHLCQAGQWPEAFALMEQEDLFDSLRKWGENGLLLKLCLLVQLQTEWDLAPLQAALLYSNLAWAFNAGGKRKEAREYLEQALRLYRENGDRKGESHVLSALGWSYLGRGQARHAGFYYQQALQISEDIGDRGRESFNLNCLGWVSSGLGQKPRALEYFTHALGICQAIGDRMGEGRALHSLGWTHLDIGKYEQALQYLEQALRIRREAGHRRNEGAVLNQMGRAYRLQRQSTAALSYLEQALNISKETGDRGLQAYIFYQMGLVYSDTEQYERAQELLEQALHLCKELEDRHTEGHTTNGLGKVYAALGKSEQAITHFQQALLIGKEVEDQWCQGAALRNLGTYFFKAWFKMSVNQCDK